MGNGETVAKEGENCEGFNEFTGNPFPNCDTGLVCKRTAEISIPGAGKTCVKTGSNSPCCFRYGFGARMVPCCMEVISCDKHAEILENIEENGPMVGGAIGKHQSCPNDAAHT